MLREVALMTNPIKLLVYTVALAVAPVAAFAADTIPANSSTGAVLTLDRELQVYSYIDSPTDRDWWRVSLNKGAAYVLRGVASNCSVTVSVYNSASKKLKTATCSASYVGGFEFIPPATGTYYVEYAGNGRASSYPSYYYPDALKDCAATKTTTCTQPLDTDFSTRLQLKNDSDWRAINLIGNRLYTASATEGNSFFLSIRKPDGTILAFRSGYYPGFTFRPASTGKYFVEVKSTQDVYFGSNNVRYIVANGNILARLSAERATKEATRLIVTDRAPHTLDAAKAQAGNEVIAGGK